MNTLACYTSKKCVQRFGIFLNIQSVLMKYIPSAPCSYASTIDPIEAITTNFQKEQKHVCDIKHYQDFSINLLNSMSIDQLEKHILDSLEKTEYKKVEQLLKECYNTKKIVTKTLLLKLLQTYSFIGKVNMIILLQNYCVKFYPHLYIRNGEYKHYLARAQCMKGNADQGLTLLKECYNDNVNLRGLYRFIFRELIYDTVQNKSEASLVIFKKHILEFSNRWKDHYPLVCFWHICWTSSWFSDQILAQELVELSEPLRNIIKERAPALSMNCLRNEYNEDAVVRLLQLLLKYEMMLEYAKVLEILFGYKLRNKDIRGCREIIHNCEVLGIILPSSQQGKYIKMLINKDDTNTLVSEYSSRVFKLKF